MSRPVYPIDAFVLHRLIRQQGSNNVDFIRGRMIQMLSKG